MSQSTATSAMDVAKYLLHLANREEEREPISPLRLQKLLYYVQVWTLGERGRRMFHEDIQAWDLGPVVPEVYREFKSLGGGTISAERADANPNLTAAEKEDIESVWTAYKRYSAIGLSELTHSELPYRLTYKPQTPKGRCERVIDDALMIRHYRDQLADAQSRLSLRRNELMEQARRNARRISGREAI